jgi:hypothetical protein
MTKLERLIDRAKRLRMRAESMGRLTTAMHESGEEGLSERAARETFRALRAERIVLKVLEKTRMESAMRTPH